MKTIGRAYCFQTLFQFCVFSSQNGRSASFLAVDALVVVVVVVAVALALAFALVDAIVVAMLAIVVVIVVVIGGAVVLHKSQNSGSPWRAGRARKPATTITLAFSLAFS